MTNLDFLNDLSKVAFHVLKRPRMIWHIVLLIVSFSFTSTLVGQHSEPKRLAPESHIGVYLRNGNYTNSAGGLVGASIETSYYNLNRE